MGIYLHLKSFIQHTCTGWYGFMDRSDAWVMSQPAEELGTKVVIILVTLFVVIVILWRVLYWLENNKNEGKITVFHSIYSALKTASVYIGVIVVWLGLIAGISFLVVHNIWGRI